MTNNPLRLRQLFERYAQGTSTQEELQEMWNLMKEYGENDMLEEDMKNWWKSEMKGDDPPLHTDATKIFQAVIEKEKKLRQGLDQWNSRPRKIRWKWVAAAALILICVSSYFFLERIDQQQASPSATITAPDIQAPQINRAVIKLANGQLVYLDSSKSGVLAVQGGIKINKVEDGEINYSNLDSKSLAKNVETEYNTLSNPRGSKVIAITLADGSRVWLNAGSSLTFPVAFNGNERKVTMSGEAYFEVEHNNTRPFRVKVGGEIIEDLGTRFNVSAYTDEPALRTTLLEGAVKLSLINENSTSPDNKKSILLQPGEQATLDNSSSEQPILKVKQLDDVEEVIAWKSGRFRFNSVDIASVMRQAARWYDVDVIYKGYVKGTISGGVARTKNISELLKILELTGKVRFTLEGRKVTVYAVGDAH